MSDRDITMMRELIVGLAESQAMVIQHLIKTGVAEKQDIANAFDFMASEFKRLAPDSQLSQPMFFIRERLENAFPDFPPPPPSSPGSPSKPDRPDWFRGVLDGGKL